MHSPTIQKLINLFSKFPTIGPRTAARFVFYLLGLEKEEIEELCSTILKLKENIKLCKFCYKSFEEEGELCEICQDPRRDKTLICLIEKETDLIPIEKTKKYQGLYFILGGTISALPPKGRAPEFKKFTPLNSAEGNLTRLRVKKLIEMVKNPEIGKEEKSSSSSPFAVTQVKEVIIALNPTTEGETTALYLERMLKSLNKKTTRLGRGLPMGGELEYADEETLSSALESRK